MNSTPILPAIDAEATKVHLSLGISNERAKELSALINSSLKESVVAEINSVGIDQGKWLQLMQPHIFTAAEALLVGYGMRKQLQAVKENPLFQLLQEMSSALQEKPHSSN